MRTYTDLKDVTKIKRSKWPKFSEIAFKACIVVAVECRRLINLLVLSFIDIFFMVHVFLYYNRNDVHNEKLHFLITIIQIVN